MCYSKGAEGKVEESMELLKEVEDLKNQKKVAEVIKCLWYTDCHDTSDSTLCCCYSNRL